ncbi:hypothetical protein ACJRO7_008204 [Eucalyptus globulus]|uniref:ATPase AAA-type core domain-containing protein n=1 Tax=Eucalyptus globulus TaxID=34317 RepID=A0ABD3IQF8_EUCGL
MRPYSVVLFDEVEKAHIAVFNVLLQVLDDGRLTDGQGQTVDFTKTVIVMTSNLVDFTKTVIVMTSNLGAKHLVSGLKGECSMQAARNGVMQEVRHEIPFINLSSHLILRGVIIRILMYLFNGTGEGHFRLELLNLLDEIVVFDPLSHEQLRKVTSLQMKDVASRLAERDIALAVIDAALDFVLAESHDLVHRYLVLYLVGLSRVIL